jgi:hypothetical protein
VEDGSAHCVYQPVVEPEAEAAAAAEAAASEAAEAAATDAELAKADELVADSEADPEAKLEAEADARAVADARAAAEPAAGGTGLSDLERGGTTPGLRRQGGSRGLLTPTVASPDPLRIAVQLFPRESLHVYKLRGDPPHTRLLRTPGVKNDDEECGSGFAGTGGECAQCKPGNEPNPGGDGLPRGTTCVACATGSAGSDGTCSACGDGTEPNGDQTACQPAGVYSTTTTTATAAAMAADEASEEDMLRDREPWPPLAEAEPEAESEAEAGIADASAGVADAEAAEAAAELAEPETEPEAAGPVAEPEAVVDRVIPDCHFRKRAAEYDRKPGKAVVLHCEVTLGYKPEIHRVDPESGSTLKALIGIFSYTAGSTCEVWVNPVSFTL